MSIYYVRLSYAMIVALVDIEQHYKGDDTPARSKRTLAALERRELIRPLKDLGYALTARGKAYLSMARYEYKTADEFLERAAA